MFDNLFKVEEYTSLLFFTGCIALLAAVVPVICRRKHISAPVVYLLVGFVVFFFFSDLEIDLDDHLKTVEHITEFVIFVALANAGIRITEPFKWRTWKNAFWLLAVTMPITIIGAAFIGHWFLGFGPATAVLFGGLIAPTDPVLASELQTSEPGAPDKSQIKLGLTAEAGINDGIAFPFIWLGIYIATKGENYGDWLVPWFLFEFVYKIAAGVIVGLITGYLLYRAIFLVSRNVETVGAISRGILSLALLLLPYALAEMVSGYGFLAVFFSACIFSNSKRNLEHASSLHDFNEELESFVVALIFIVSGFFIAINYENILDFHVLLTALAMVLVVRPIAGYIGLLGRKINPFQRFVLSFYGLRGIGSIYYLAFALGAAAFADRTKLISVTTATILLSVIVHGLSARTIKKYIRKYDWQASEQKNTETVL
ncbi:MAG: sodium:proton exchanger [Flavobacterium sp.]|uniref:cation:proton antiporter n=1 Tax=Flavobacterium sp. TaxID=239 RepID=UPI0012188BB5|nr:cation:proton antiporter [Flavobacterium sp.]RZJ67772.1 MAG: sodium:proton exchanger [Flavobacterium sp.]